MGLEFYNSNTKRGKQNQHNQNVSSGGPQQSGGNGMKSGVGVSSIGGGSSSGGGTGPTVLNRNPKDVNANLKQMTNKLKEVTLVDRNGAASANNKTGAGAASSQSTVAAASEKPVNDDPTAEICILRDGSKLSELKFQPPWESKIGQLQYTCYVLRRFSRYYLDSRNDVIVRCYPLRNWDYMQTTIALIYMTCEQARMIRPEKIEAIQLPYEGENERQQQFVLHSSGSQHNWKVTSRMLIRVALRSPIEAENFIEMFNFGAKNFFTTSSVFTQYIPPFSHHDLTFPERRLRLSLLRLCREKNSAGRVNEGLNIRRRQQGSLQDIYFSDGIRLFKRRSYGISYNEVVLLPQFTQDHLIQNAVMTLRKYATMIEQKRASVILQGCELTGHGDGVNTEDIESIKSLISKVTSSEEFKEYFIDEEINSDKLHIQDIVRVPRRRPFPSVPEETEPRSFPPPLVRVTFTSAVAARAFVLLFDKITYKKANEEHKDDGEKENDKSEKSNERKKPRKVRVHRDLTPPELALFYAMGDLCRGKNNEEREKLVATKEAEGGGNKDEGGPQPGTSNQVEKLTIRIPLPIVHFVRNYKILVKEVNAAALEP